MQLDDGVNDKFLKYELFHFVNIFLFKIKSNKNEKNSFITLKPQTKFNAFINSAFYLF